MSVGFLVDCFYYEVGQPDFLHSFFSSVSYNLEKNGWGSRFPKLLKQLYHDRLPYTDVPLAIEEVRVIQEELSKLSPDKVIWDIEDLTKLPPWGTDISPMVTNLENYFATPGGETFTELLLTALSVAEVERQDLVIKKL
ncbi:immunity 70 family protein [Sulfoacidibacillus thermotolerans]|uniref:Immunity protein 70 n=1 Tax=Sulfoacidibacillus thermotolerans TaxID=1765684 RepID=A0A2U3CRI9_SULT2|nr:immunity 70 family protein [Sulfoacidibacillus thermotolerans]PWI51655.1 hypothetical protein BM613_14280 [Sulfoacidibacillus thermotolerans]